MPLRVTVNGGFDLEGFKSKEVFEDVNVVLDTDSDINIGVRNFVDKSKILYVNKTAFESILVEKV